MSVVDINFRALADNIQTLCWMENPDGYIIWYNKRWYEYTGTTPAAMEGWGWQSVHDPNELPSVLMKWRNCIATGMPFDMVFPLKAADGSFSSFLTQVSPTFDGSGNVTGWFGVNTDISEQIKAERKLALVSTELSHRIKNIFAVVSGLISLAAKNHPGAKEFAAEVRQRIAALGRSHDFIRPRALGRQSTLFGLFDELLSPYQNNKRIQLLGDNVPVEEHAATPLALLLHELATNATKYGALSVSEGRVTVKVTSAPAANRLEIVWCEENGPPVVEPTQTGFGSQLAMLSIEGQMGGSIVYDWRKDGLTVRCLVPFSAIVTSDLQDAGTDVR